MKQNWKTIRKGVSGGVGTMVSLAILLVPSSSFGAEVNPPLPESISARVSLADLNLATAAGSEVAHARISAAARKLCREFRDSTSIAARETYAECWAQARDEALQQLEMQTQAREHEAVARAVSARRDD